uniref:Uncharacterized protein n=1 Tax=viral metagenome TaxID=1070528 RepID=A0A6M3K246_9ZZZZ
MAEWKFTQREPNNHFGVKGFNGGKDIGVLFKAGAVGFVVSEDDKAEEIAVVLEQVVKSIREGKAGLYISKKAKQDQAEYRGLK